jgi:hypothetical protein
MDVRLPDGTVIKDVPDGTTKAQLTEKLKANGMAVPSEWLVPQKEPSTTERIGAGIREVPRQLGLTARYGIEGLGRMLDVGTEPIRQLAVNPLLRLAGATPAASTGSASASLADMLGLPSPKNADERVVGDAARTMAGAGGMAGLSRSAANMTQGVASSVLSRMAARPGVQLGAAAGAGLAGGSVREAGGGPLEQFGAALGGGLLGGLAVDKIGSIAKSGAAAIKAAMTPRDMELAKADQVINLTLQRSGVDWSTVPERVKQGMRDEVASALKTGQPLNADAMRRLLVFKSADVQPTVGQLTQDPGQITREMNLAKVGANSIDPSLQNLPQLQNRNVSNLLRQLDEAGATRAKSPADTARLGIESLDSTIARETGATSALYKAARDTQGRSLPLEGGTFTTRANQLLDEANVGSFLPPDIAKKMNAIANGDYPLTVDVAEQLKTSIGNLQRGSSDGNVRRALGIVRQALDDAPLQNGRTGSLSPTLPGSVPPSTAAIGEESINAFNEARTSHRSWMRRVEGNPALKAVVDGVEPDRFVQKYLIGNGATAADVRSLKNELGPQATDAFRDYIVKYLKDAATNSTDDVAKFSPHAYNKALRDLREKMPIFFTQDEVQKMRDLGNAAKYMMAQPAGSAVNNSNSGALMIGKGLDLIQGMSQKLPLGLKDTISGTIQGMQQRQVMNPRNALLMEIPPAENPLLINPLFGSLVGPAYQAEQNRGR